MDKLRNILVNPASRFMSRNKEVKSEGAVSPLFNQSDSRELASKGATGCYELNVTAERFEEELASIYNGYTSKISDSANLSQSTIDESANLSQSTIDDDFEILQPDTARRAKLYTPGLAAVVAELEKDNLPVKSSHVKEVKFVVSNQNENQFISEILTLAKGANDSFALTSLSPPKREVVEGKPKPGTYYKVLIESISCVAEKNKIKMAEGKTPIPFLMLFGNAPSSLGAGVEFAPKEYLAAIMKDIPTELHPFIKLELAAFNPKFASWNHSKIIVADNKVNVGGINLFEEYNDPNRRVRDLSCTMENREMAQAARAFIQDLEGAPGVNLLNKSPNGGSKLGFIMDVVNQNFTHFNPKAVWDGREFSDNMDATRKNFTGLDISMPQDNIPQNLDVEHQHNTLSVPTMGLINAKTQTSEVVALAIINNAKTSLKISQQSILFMYGGKAGDMLKGGYSHQISDAISAALKRGVKVEILVSADQSKANNNNDYNGMPIKQLEEQLLKGVENAKLQIRNTRNKDGVPVPNHTKLVMADDSMFTIGSHNSYDKSHAEYTQLIDDGDLGQQLLRDCWNQEWKNAGVVPEKDQKFVDIELADYTSLGKKY